MCPGQTCCPSENRVHHPAYLRRTTGTQGHGMRYILNARREKNGNIEARALDVGQLNSGKPINMACYWLGAIVIGTGVGVSRADNQFSRDMQRTACRG
jgi:hypothetical protein